MNEGVSEFFLDTMVFSFSNLNTFITCPYAWYQHYVVGEQGLSNPYGEFGTCCHKVLEQFERGDIKNDGSVVDAYMDTFDKHLPEGSFDENTTDRLFNIGFEYFSGLSPEKLNLKDNRIVAVEEQINFKIGDHDFVGIIDLLLQNKKTGGYIILDHKTGEYPLTLKGTVKAKCEDKYEEYVRQLYLYAKAVNEKYGEFPKSLQWNFLKTGDWMTLPFEEQKYDETIEWAESVIKQIYEETEFNRNPTYFFCKNICNYRELCLE